MAQVVIIYATFPNNRLARETARIVVEERRVACVNILANMYSVYRWEGKLEEVDEVVMIAKTTTEQAENAVARIKELHPYDCPAILTFTASGGYSPFLAWVKDMVSSPEEGAA